MVRKINARKAILAGLIKTREAADRAVKKAHDLLIAGQKDWKSAKAAIPVAKKALQDAKDAIIKMNSDKKKAISRQDEVIRGLQKRQKAAEANRETMAKREQKAFAAKLVAEKERALATKRRLAARKNYDQKNEESRRATEASKKERARLSHKWR